MSASSRLGLDLQTPGTNRNAWGGNLNQRGLQLLEDKAAGVKTIALTGNYTLSNDNFIANDARQAVLIFTGSGLGADPVVTVPSSENWWHVVNLANRAVTMTNGSGSSLSVAQGRRVVVYSTGTTLGIVDLAAEAAAQAALASASASQAALIYDSFDDRYLGAFSSLPSVDNDGNPLVVGAIAFLIGQGMRVWNGTGWDYFVPEASSYYTKAQSDARLPANIHAATAKAVPADDDEIAIADSAAAFGLKKLTWGAMVAALTTGGEKLIGTLTPATQALSSLAIPAGYKRLRLRFKGPVFSSNGNVRLALSSNGGASFGSPADLLTSVSSSPIFGEVDVTFVGEASSGKIMLANLLTGGTLTSRATASGTISGVVNAIQLSGSDAFGSSSGTVDVYGIK